MSERCEKCGGTDILVRYFAKGQMLDRHQRSTDTRWKDLPDNVGEDVYRLTATEPLLRKRCRTCQWWWTEEPGAAPEPTAEPEVSEKDAEEALYVAQTAIERAKVMTHLNVGGDPVQTRTATVSAWVLEKLIALATRPPSEALREAWLDGWCNEGYELDGGDMSAEDLADEYARR